MKYDKYTIESTSYNNSFWNEMMKGNNKSEILQKGNIGNGMFVLPYDSNKQYNELINNECIFRKIATNLKSKESDNTILISDSDDTAEWSQRNDPESIKNVVNNFIRKRMECHTLSIISRMDSDIIEDKKFDLEDYLIKRFAKCFGKAEENAFINGTGIKMPIGILNDTNGAEVGITSTELTFDNVISLYFSVKPEYRTKGSWLMNDEIAKTLYTLKDNDGNYIWNHNTNTIMGRPVYITNAMPSIGKVIAFGDFSYYWVVTRMPISARAINELFIANQQIGYLASEYLDGKLIRPAAIKVLQLN